VGEGDALTMWRSLALLAWALASSPALACSSAPPAGVQPASLEEALRLTAGRADHIVYAMVVRPIREESEPRTGRIRILHVYKGGLHVGQQLTTFYRFLQDCPVPRPQRMPRVPRGAVGVLLLQGAQEPVEFPGFLSDGNLAAMLRFGIIRSARMPPA
jgi:hypothetical protein